MSEDRLREVISQLFKMVLWLTVIQTIVWLVHGGRDGLLEEWISFALGEQGTDAFWTLSIMWMFLAIMPVVITAFDNKPVRWFTFVIACLFVLLSSQDWVGNQDSQAYQYPLKVAHSLGALLLAWTSFKWARFKSQ